MAQLARLPRLTTWDRWARHATVLVAGAFVVSLLFGFGYSLGPVWRIALPVAGALGFVALDRVLMRALSRPVIARKEGEWIRIAGHPPFRVGAGEILLASEWTKEESPTLRTSVRHSRGPSFGVTGEPLVARAFAEALCKLGRFPMQWTQPGGEGERRSPDELDLPYAERVRGNPPEAPAPHPDRIAVTLRQDESIELAPRRANRSWKAIGAAALIGGLGLALSLRQGLAGLFRDAHNDSLGLIMALLGLGYAASGLLQHLERRWIHVSSRGIDGRFHFFALPIGAWHIPASEIESVYIDRQSRTLVIMGDRLLRRIPIGYASELHACHAIVTRALLGLRQPREVFGQPLETSAPPARVHQR